MASEGPVTFRPPLRDVARSLFLGAVGGAVLGKLAGAPLLVSALFGAASAGLALWVRQLTSLRVIAREGGLQIVRRDAPFSAAWSDLRLGFGASQREDGSVQRYAVVADRSGRSFAFAELAGRPPCAAVMGADGRTVEVVDLSEATLLLALIVQRTPVWNVFPEELLAQAQPATPEAEAAPEQGEAEEPVRDPAGARYGVWGLVMKLGGKLFGALAKLGAGTVKAVKTANVGWALLSAASYSLLFSWKFALAIMLQLFVHEYGHVHAMKRTGMKVRGMYFVPFLGALAVTEDAFTSRRQQAYVALSGPIWGSLFALVPLGLYLWTRDPLFAAIASWWAIVNLFNLLPIVPLDGGRAMQAFAYSFSSSIGLVVSLLGLAGSVVLAFQVGFSLIYFVALLGAMELVGESQAWSGIRALRLLPEPARLGLHHFVYLRSTLGPPPGGPGELLFVRRLVQRQRAARNAPMRTRQLVLWGLAYALLAAGLLLLVHFMRAVPGAEAAAGLLR